MEQYTNEKGETVVIAEMDNFRLVNAIAKYSRNQGAQDQRGETDEAIVSEDVVKALKAEALKRLAPKQND